MLISTTVSTLLVSGQVGGASAQPASGALVGRVVLCRDAFAPVADDSAGDSPLLPDVPSPGGGRPLASMSIPVPDVLVVVDGIGLSTRTDDNGRFSLTGVPPAQTLSLSVLQQADAPPLTQVPNVVVSQGQTLDLGTLVLGADPDANSGTGSCPV